MIKLMQSYRANKQGVTFYFENRRALATGIIETAGATFLIMIAEKYFKAGWFALGLVATGGMAGHLLSPIMVWMAGIRRWRAAQAAAGATAIAGLCFLAAATVAWQWVFIIATVVGSIAVTASVPLLTQMYQDNYAPNLRGKLFSRTVLVRIVAMIIFGWVAGWALKGRINQYQWLMVAYAGALFFAAYCLWRCPSRAFRPHASRNPFQALRFVSSDRAFGLTLVSWMFVGMANLIMHPLRTKYLVDPQFGIGLDTAQTATYVVVIPAIARLLMNPIWGRLFDSLNFFLMRIIINVAIALGILAFFTGGGVVGLVLGAVLFGISNAGADLAWSLWVTKVAPPSRVAEYMSVHTFLTGLRGITAPFVAFGLTAAHVPLTVLALMTTLMVVAGCAVLAPELGWFGGKRRDLVRGEDLEVERVEVPGRT